MTTKRKIIYWVATLWLAVGMLSTGAVQLLKTDAEVGNFRQLGYPVYLLGILGIWKLAGVIAVLVPKFPLVKEWAYAGFFFAMSGAALSRIMSSSSLNEVLPSLLLLVLTVVSWSFRPADRRLIASK